MYSGVNSLRQKLAGAITRRMGDQNPNDVARKSRTGITAPGLRKILKGESDLKVETLVVIAKAVGTTAPELLVEALEDNPAEVGDARSQIEHARLIEMYSDIPSQCQKDVMDLLEVLQRNHSISDRRRRQEDRRRAAAETNNAPIRVASRLKDYKDDDPGTNEEQGEPIQPVKEKKQA